MQVQSMSTLKMVKPDNKGRITLGHLADGISRFAVSKDKHNRLILDPFVEIHAKEKWLFENQSAMAQVKQGLKDSAAGNIHDKGSFAHYLRDDE